MKKISYKRIFIIFNPNSTRDSEALAESLCQDLGRLGVPVELCATQHKGHARQMGEELAAKFPGSLFISVSGDGGYNELINGLLAAKKKGADFYCAVAPGGNANDHRRLTKTTALVDAISSGKFAPLDALELTVRQQSGDKQVYHAHSYIGLGITPWVATEINRRRPGIVGEKFIAFWHLLKLRPFQIEHQGQLKSFDSLVFANIAEMSKLLTLADDSNPQDGKFEVVEIEHRGRLGFLLTATKSVFGWVKKQPAVSSYSFKSVSKMPLQLDGEVVNLKKGDLAEVRALPQVLKSFA